MTPSRHARRLIAAGCALLAACAVERPSTSAADTVADVAAVPAIDSTPTPTDTARVGPASIDTSRADPVLDTIAIAPTPAELAELRAMLALPLAGISAAELIDSFDDARGGARLHEALDIPAPRGTPVLSAAPGRVVRLFSSEAGGLMVYAADPTGRFVLMYGHLDGYEPGIREGDALRAGQTIGYVGTTGNAPPDLPHLHFAITRVSSVARWWQGTPVNPVPLLQR